MKKMPDLNRVVALLTGTVFATMIPAIAGASEQTLVAQSTLKTACRLLVRPKGVMLKVHKAPSLRSPVLTTITPKKIVWVTLTTDNVVKSNQSDGYNWVQLDMVKTFGSTTSGYGWIYNTDLKNSPNQSNLEASLPC